MKRIPREQYEVAYQVGMRWYLEKFRGSDTFRILENSGMEDATAEILAGNVSYMLKGEVYKRAMSIETTEDYLSWIRRDRGDNDLKSSLRALAAHIEYWESTHPGRRKGLREILERYEVLLRVPTEGAIRLEYDDSESRGYVDILPLKLFAEEGTKKAIIHTVRHHRSGRDYEAKCDITVRAQEAELDYQPYAAFNAKNEMLLGVARLQFEDTDRTAIQFVEWKPKNAETFKNCPVKIPSFVVSPAQPYVPPSEAAQKSARMVRDRPGQIAFRRYLKAVYNNCCCISGCSVPQVLQGAHIDRYMSRDSDNVRNGLLLRSDLHALFDAYLISINPETFRIHVAEGARCTAGYGDLDGILFRRPSDSSHHPDPGALSRHWSRFQQIQKRKTLL